MNKELLDQFNIELKSFELAFKHKNHKECFYFLSRAHILSQKSVRLHLRTHWLMFQYSLKNKNYQEVRGQVLRLIVTIPGHLFGKVPVGNIGWATVKLTETMEIPEDLKQIYFKA
jgi:hypothetical protein